MHVSCMMQYVVRSTIWPCCHWFLQEVICRSDVRAEAGLRAVQQRMTILPRNLCFHLTDQRMMAASCCPHHCICSWNCLLWAHFLRVNSFIAWHVHTCPMGGDRASGEARGPPDVEILLLLPLLLLYRLSWATTMDFSQLIKGQGFYNYIAPWKIPGNRSMQIKFRQLYWCMWDHTAASAYRKFDTEHSQNIVHRLDRTRPRDV